MENEPKKSRTPLEIAIRWVRIIMGFTVLLIGIVMIVLPGPAIVVIPMGLAILATQYAWARRYLNRIKEGGEKLGTIFFRKHPKPSDSENPIDPQK